MLLRDLIIAELPMTFRAQKPAFCCFCATMLALATLAVAVVMFAAFSFADMSRHSASEYAAAIKGAAAYRR